MITQFKLGNLTCYVCDDIISEYNSYLEILIGINRDVKNSGTTHFLEHCLFNYKDTEILNEAQKENISLNAYTSHYCITMTASSLNEKFTDMLSYLKKVYSGQFSEERVSKERSIIECEIDEYASQKMLIEHYKFLNRVYGKRRDSILGTKASIAKITYEELKDLHANMFYYGNSSVYIHTKIPVEEVKRRFEESFFDVQFDKSLKEIKNTLVPFEYHDTLSLRPNDVIKPSLRINGLLTILFKGSVVEKTLKDTHLSDMIYNLFSNNNFNSCLFLALREEKQYCYSVSCSEVSHIEEHNTVDHIISVQTKEFGEECKNIILQITNKLKEGITEEEFDIVKRISKEGLINNLTTRAAIRSVLKYDHCLFGKSITLSENKEIIDLITLDDLNERLYDVFSKDPIISYTVIE